MAENKGKAAEQGERLAERRTHIIEAAAALFIQKGFHQTGMRDIAGLAGISLGNLYNHFKGKADIIAAIGELETTDLEPLLEPLEAAGERGPQALLTFARGYFDLYASPAYAALSAEITAEVFRNPVIGGFFQGTRTRIEAAVARHLPEDLEDRATAAGFVIDLIERAGQRSIGRPGSEREAIRRMLFEVLTRIAVRPTQ